MYMVIRFENINTGDNIYPNDIDCLDENNCVAVLEGLG